MRYLRRRKPVSSWPSLPACTCPPGLFRFEYPHALKVGAYCPACVLVTLRDETDVARMLDLYEDDLGLKAAIIQSLLVQLGRRHEELNAGLEAPRPAKVMEIIPFD